MSWLEKSEKANETMPELPDVDIYKRYLDATSLHKEIKEVEVTNTKVLEKISSRKLMNELKGQAMKSSRRHGKYLFVKFGASLWLVLHFGMTGNRSYYGEDKDMPKHGRLVLTFSNGYHLAYISQRLLGKVSLTDNPDRYVEGKGLGPDAMSLNLQGFRDVLSGRGMIKPTLMNQRRIAGVGNVYSDEILYLAGLHPKKDRRSLSKGQTKELYRYMRHVLRTAIRKNADPRKMPKSWLLPIRGSEGTCPRCGGTIKSLKAAGRTAWYCPSHQGR